MASVSVRRANPPPFYHHTHTNREERKTEAGTFVYLLCEPGMLRDETVDVADWRTYLQYIRYVGISSDLRKRYKQHCNPKKANKHPVARWAKEVHPVMIQVEGPIRNRALARIRERMWIRQLEDAGCRLLNMRSL